MKDMKHEQPERGLAEGLGDSRDDTLRDMVRSFYSRKMRATAISSARAMPAMWRRGWKTAP